MYGSAQIVGTSCTNYDRMDTPAGGNPRVVWGSKTAIQSVEKTLVEITQRQSRLGSTDLHDSNNICKDLAKIRPIINLGITISSIDSIPAAYDVSISLRGTSG